MKKDEYINVLNQVIKQINHSWDLNTAQKGMMGLFGEKIIPFGKIDLDKDGLHRKDAQLLFFLL